MGSDSFRDADGTYNKRLLGLGLLALLAVVGTGVGTIALTDSGQTAPDRPGTQMTPGPAEPTPAATPKTDFASTESGGSGSPPPSALLTETPTHTPANSQSDGPTTSNTTEQ